MQKIKKLISQVTHSRTYKMAYYKTVCKCARCSPHKGCNQSGKGNRQRSWKQFRKTKWK